MATRTCIHCDRALPLESFREGSKSRVCDEHLRVFRLGYVLGTARKRAFNCLRLRARHDRFAFGKDFIRFNVDDVLDFLTEEQIANFSAWSLVPLHPDEVLSPNNMVVVTNFQRRYLMCQWRSARCIKAYEAHLKFLLSKDSST